MQLSQFYVGRKLVYEALILLLTKPLTKSALKELTENDSLLTLADHSEGLATIYKLIQSIPQERLELFLEEEKFAFNDLFIGPDKLLAPPWESVYRSKERLMFEKETLEVRELYHKHNLKFIFENNQPDDYIGAELEFMLIMLTRSIEASENNDQPTLIKLTDAQLTMLKDHLLHWINPFCTDILTKSNSEFYKGVATLLQEFIICDYDIMQNFKEAL